MTAVVFKNSVFGVSVALKALHSDLLYEEWQDGGNTLCVSRLLGTHREFGNSYPSPGSSQEAARRAHILAWRDELAKVPSAHNT